MLLRFSVSNFLSIAERADLSLVATKLKGRSVALAEIPGAIDLKALPSAIFYGANASGKTSLLSALRFVKQTITLSHTRGNPEGGVPRTAFALDPAYADTPSLFEVEFIVDQVRHIFGFECNDDRFLAEWLYAFPEGKRRKLYERTENEVDFGPSMKGAKRALVDFMRQNSLFISTATQNDHEELSKIVKYFRRVKFSSSIDVSTAMINDTFKKGEIDRRTISFLQQIGTGVVAHRQKDAVVPEQIKLLKSDFMLLVRKYAGEKAPSVDERDDLGRDVSIELAHQGVGGDECYLHLSNESSGTRRLLIIMNMIFRAIDDGGLVVIDELDASLHTHATAMILELFSDPAINFRGAQLIAAVHDTNLLNSEYLRRDQAWFCQKDQRGSTRIYSLADIKTRTSSNFEQGYLEGRFGAIPPAGSLIALTTEGE